MNILTRMLGLVLAGLLATACAGTKTSESWSDQNYKGKIKNVYIIAIAKNELNRMIFEDRFENRLISEGVKAIASFKDLPTNNEADKETIIKKMSANNCDSVLLTRVISQRTKSSIGSSRGYYVYSPGPYSGDGPRIRKVKTDYASNWSSYYQQGRMNYVPPSKVSAVILTVESVLYDLQTEELIWSAQLETHFEGNMEGMVRKFVDEVTKDLKGKGLI